ncbi:uncharacterized protein EAE98_010449 [Botrytis deweyae]|uniref:NACHT domain-containing protein n=1 Tax=Botrytis deweyae TaxID=2478750 RepID=A0ABQ7I8T8_9HELO|nr:uncharacterized protein EAE98_010449 [Botrytis deweyae]KAF7917018.1 hypothetical protein EAE98_010449 [Botrytis deweyae]
MKFRNCLSRRFKQKIRPRSDAQALESVGDEAVDGPSHGLPDAQPNDILPISVACSPTPTTVVAAPVGRQDRISLWVEAREKLCQDPELGKLVDSYQRDLLEQHQLGKCHDQTNIYTCGWLIKYLDKDKPEQKEGSDDETPATGDVEATLSFQRIILEDQVEAWKASHLTGINKVLGKSVKMIITGKDFITTAISGDPHASLAWAGVLIFLPILLNPITQDEDALTGFEEICHVLIRSEVVERRLWKEPQSQTNAKLYLQDLIRSWRLATIDLYAAILEYQIRFSTHLSRNGSTRFFRNFVLADPWNDILQTVRKHQTTIDEHLKSFSFELLSEIDKTVSSLEDRLIEVVQSQNEIVGGQKDLIKQVASFGNDQGQTRQSELLLKLDPPQGAVVNSPANEHDSCQEKTRVTALEEIKKWHDNAAGPAVFWLKGAAGTGKSTIAHTVAQWIDGQTILGASFFFARNKEGRGDATRFFRSIAFQLASIDPTIKRYICEAIEKDQNIDNWSFSDQWKKLVCGPSNQTEDKRSLLVVVDALDECLGKDIKIIMKLIADREGDTRPIRFFITSRPETAVRNAFRIRNVPQTDNATCCEYALDEMHEDENEHDILIYIRTRTRAILEEHDEISCLEVSGSQQWPGEENIRELGRRSGRLFIYAAVVCRYIDEGKDAQQRLEFVLKGGTGSQSSLQALDNLYREIMAQFCRTSAECQEFINLFKPVVCAIVSVFDPLSEIDLARLLDRKLNNIKGAMKPLYSVLDMAQNVSDKQCATIKLMHQSFRDFLLDQQRSLDPFWISEEKAHEEIFHHCLNILQNKTLNVNGCSFKGLEAGISKHLLIDHGHVRYACRYWVSHLQCSGLRISDDGEAHLFLQKYFIQWLEALCHLGEITKAIDFISSLHSLVEIGNVDTSELSAFLQDAKRFITRNIGMVANSPAQLYCSALVFAPEESLVKKAFKDLVLPGIKIRSKMEPTWSAELQTLDCGGGPFSLSEDSILFASCCGGDVKIWNRVTGILQNTITVDEIAVDAISFSKDGTLLAVSVPGFVDIWNAATWVLQSRLSHNHVIDACRWPPNYNRTLSFSVEDGFLIFHKKTEVTVWRRCQDHGTAWNTEFNYEFPSRIMNLANEYSNSRVLSAEFLPDLQLLLAIGTDLTIEFWRVENGDWISLGQIWGCNCILSPNGSSAVVVSWVQEICVWNLTTATLCQKHTLKDHSYLQRGNRWTGMTFSKNGKYFALISTSTTIEIWNSIDWTLQTTLDYHFIPSSVSFSRDNKLLALCSRDGVVGFWDLAVTILQEDLESHSQSLKTVNFSPNGNVIVCEASEGTTQLRDSIMWTVKQTLECPRSAVSQLSRYYDDFVVGSIPIDLWKHETRLEEHESVDKILPWTHHKSFSDNGRRSCVGLALAVSPNTGLVAISDCHERVGLFNTNNGAQIELHIGAAYPRICYDSKYLAFSLDSKILALGSWYGDIHLWETATALERFPQTLESSLSSKDAIVAISSDGQIAALISNDNTIDIWCHVRAHNPKWVHIQNLTHNSEKLCAMALSSDGSILVTASIDQCIMVWCSTMEKPCCWFLQQTLSDGINDSITRVEISSSGKKIMAVCGTIQIWNRIEERPPIWVSTRKSPIKGGFGPMILAVLSPNGGSVAAGYENGDIAIWDIAFTETQQIHKEKEAPPCFRSFTSLAYSPDSIFLVTSRKGGTVTVWEPTPETHDIQCRYNYRLYPEEICPTKIIISPDNKLFILGFSDGTIRILSIVSQQLVCTQALVEYYGNVEAISVFPDSEQLVVVYSFENDITISCARLRHIQTLSQPCGAQNRVYCVTAVAFSSDSRVLVSSNKISMFGNATIRVWGRSETEHSAWTLQQTFDINTECNKLVLSQDHQYFQTDKGPLWVDPLFMGGSSPKRTILSNIQVKRDRIEWGSADNRKVMLFLPNHRPTSCDVYDNNIVMVNESGRATFMELT